MHALLPAAAGGQRSPKFGANRPPLVYACCRGAAAMIEGVVMIEKANALLIDCPWKGLVSRR
jgi:hypothetical protein